MSDVLQGTVLKWIVEEQQQFTTLIPIFSLDSVYETSSLESLLHDFMTLMLGV